MLRITGFFTVTVVALLLGGCNHAKTSSEVAKDVNAASQSAQDKIANAEDKAADKERSAEKDVRSEERDAQHTKAVQTENIAETRAEGERNVALAKCEGLSGDRQQACKDEAKAAYDLHVAQAKQARSETDPKR